MKQGDVRARIDEVFESSSDVIADLLGLVEGDPMGSVVLLRQPCGRVTASYGPLSDLPPGALRDEALRQWSIQSTSYEREAQPFGGIVAPTMFTTLIAVTSQSEIRLIIVPRCTDKRSALIPLTHKRDGLALYCAGMSKPVMVRLDPKMTLQEQTLALLAGRQ